MRNRTLRLLCSARPGECSRGRRTSTKLREKGHLGVPGEAKRHTPDPLANRSARNPLSEYDSLNQLTVNTNVVVAGVFAESLPVPVIVIV